MIHVEFKNHISYQTIFQASLKVVPHVGEYVFFEAEDADINPRFEVTAVEHYMPVKRAHRIYVYVKGR